LVSAARLVAAGRAWHKVAMYRLALVAALILVSPVAAQEAEPPTPASVVAAAAPQEWVAIAPEDLLVMDLTPDAANRARRVVIQLLPAPFSQPWVANIRTLAAAHWWDGTQVYRVVDNWVAQWGAGEDGREAGFAEHPLPEGVVSPVADYSTRTESRAQLYEDEWLPRIQLLDTYTGAGEWIGWAGYFAGWPIASEVRFDSPETNALVRWPVHCYGSVGVARDLAPDTGTGAELYAVIGHAPRQLDRNIAVVGRVIEGIEHLSTLPRGTAEAGVYATRAEDTPIVSIRLGNDLPDLPRFEYLSTQSESFARYVAVRTNRSDAFYTVPAGGVDVCNVQVPIRRGAP
jgi:peptidylprolyl isomerase